MPNWGVYVSAVFDVVVMLVTWFALWEGPGLKPGKGQNTLTAWVRRKLGVHPYNPKHGFYAALVFCVVCAILSGVPVWFVIHIIWG